MNRLTLALAIATVLGSTLMGLALAAPAGVGVEAPSSPVVDSQAAPAEVGAESVQPAAPSAADNLQIWMSDVEDGERIHSVVSTTNMVYAVVSYEDALNEQFEVMLRDLSGIVVKRGPVLANGTGRSSVAISVTDFIDTYRRVLDSERTSGERCASDACVMKRSLEEAQFNCQSAPPAPPEWPEPPRPTVQPGNPTPTPDPQDPYGPYRLWLDSTLGHTATGRQAIAEVTRTLQAFLALPDARANAQIASGVQQAQAALHGAFDALGAVEHELTPPGGQPDVVAGCALVDSAVDAATTAITAWNQVESRLTDSHLWRLPPTTARWSGDRFEGCIRYQTDLLAVFGGSPQPAPRVSALWSVGEPSAPRLIFPSPDLVDLQYEGELGVTLPEGAKAIYAQSVTAPGANHEATILAYVTDRSCIPVNGRDISFNVNPIEAGSVSPAMATIVDGLATTILEAGQDAQNRPAVHGLVSTGGGPGPSGIAATAAFRVIGAADPSNIAFLMRQGRLINYAAGDTLNFSVQARDYYGRDVADGTVVQLSIPEGDPAEMGYHRRPLTPGDPGQPTPMPELIIVGKEFTMTTRDGMSALPESQDPGYRHTGPVLACTGEGEVTLSALIDGATANTNDENGLKTINCRANYSVNLPLTFQKHDLEATQRPPIPIETVTPTARP